jgi:ABC-type spermidine/putrescine transport system permease subunit II
LAYFLLIPQRQQGTTNQKEATMLGATEFTMIGNVLMGVMAIGGVGAMLFAAGSSLTDTHRSEWKSVETPETLPDNIRKAA